MTRYYLSGSMVRETLDGEVESVPVAPADGPNKASQLVAMCRERSASSQVDILGTPLHLQNDFEPMPSFSLDCTGDIDGEDATFVCPDTYLDMMNVVRELRLRKAQHNLGLKPTIRAAPSYRPEDEYIPDSLPVQPRFGPYPRPETRVHTVTQPSQSSMTSSTRRPQLNAYNLHQTTIHDTSAYHIKREPKA